MNNNPLVSFICTVKNGKNTLEETMSSVLSQTYENWEMIIVDDGSTDNTLNLLNHYSKNYTKINVVATEGIGRGNALNKAASLAKGSLITVIDADDVIHPEKLKLQVEVFKKNKVFLVSTDTLIIFDDEIPEWQKMENSYHVVTDISERILVKNIIHHSSVMMNKEIFKRIGQYDSERNSQFDYELWLRAYENDEVLVNLNENLTAKRIHTHQSFENKKRIKYLFSSTILQLRYNVKLKKNIHLLGVFPFRIILGMLPFKTRQRIKRLRILNKYSNFGGKNHF